MFVEPDARSQSGSVVHSFQNSATVTPALALERSSCRALSSAAAAASSVAWVSGPPMTARADSCSSLTIAPGSAVGAFDGFEDLVGEAATPLERLPVGFGSLWHVARS
jgi:hypothetical protein